MAQNTTSQNTKPKTNKERSKKRRFFGGRDGPSAKKRKLNYETDLTKSRNIILVSCQRFQEKTCGRTLKLVFTEFIEEFIKTNLETIESNKDDTNPPKKNENESNEASKQEKDEDIDVIDNNNSETETDEVNKCKTETNEDKKEKIETTDNNEADEDDDLKMNKTKEAKSEKTEENTAPTSIADAIKNELSTIHEKSVCEWIQGPDGLVVLNILDKRVKASKLLDFVFNKTHPNRPHLSPYVHKLFPLDCTSFSRTEDMIALGQRMVQQQNWDAIAKEDQYAINYKNRGNKKLSKDRMKIVAAIAGFVPNDYSVNLTNPKTVILLQTFGRTAGISIIPNGAFAKHKEYNMGNFE